MSVFIQTDVNFTDATLPILRRDFAIDGGTMWCFDLLDAYSWPKQGAPVNLDPVVDLSETANGFVSGANGMSWSNGFVYALGTLGYIKAPTSSDLASDVEGFGVTCWVKFSDLSDSAASIMAMAKSGAGFSNTQYSFSTALSTLRVHFAGGASTIGVMSGVGDPTVSTGQVYQIGLTIEASGSDYIGKMWLNGALIATATRAGPMVDGLEQDAARLGGAELFAGTPGMTVYRWNANDLSEWTAEQFIAADYAARAGQFA